MSYSKPAVLNGSTRILQGFSDRPRLQKTIQRGLTK